MIKSRLYVFQNTYKDINNLILKYWKDLDLYLQFEGFEYYGFSLNENGNIEIWLHENGCCGYSDIDYKKEIPWEFITNTESWLSEQKVLLKAKKDKQLEDMKKAAIDKEVAEQQRKLKLYEELKKEFE